MRVEVAAEVVHHPLPDAMVVSLLSDAERAEHDVDHDQRDAGGERGASRGDRARRAAPRRPARRRARCRRRSSAATASSSSSALISDAPARARRRSASGAAGGSARPSGRGEAAAHARRSRPPRPRRARGCRRSRDRPAAATMSSASYSVRPSRTLSRRRSTPEVDEPRAHAPTADHLGHRSSHARAPTSTPANRRARSCDTRARPERAAHVQEPLRAAVVLGRDRHAAPCDQMPR